MLARRSKVFLKGHPVIETPLLLTSFSSKGFPQVADIMKFMAEFITRPILVSAYDIHYGHLRKKITFSNLIFLDSGGYEARVEHDLSEAYGWPYQPKRWNRKFYERVLKNWTSKVPTVTVTYDSPVQFQKLQDQIASGRQLQTAYPDFLWELLIKPETRKDRFLSLERIIKNAHHFRDFAIIGVTEKEIDDSVFGAMTKIARLRRALDSADVKSPIHIFGCLDPLTTLLYFIAGAEIFDGLTWLRFGYHEGRTLYYQNYGVLRDSDGIRRRKDDQFYQMWSKNYFYLEKLRTQMINFLDSHEYGQFQSLATVVEDADRQLQALVAESR